MKKLFVMMLLIACSAQAEIHKWVDANGRTHFGERPPSGVESARLDKPVETTGDASPEAAGEEQAKINEMTNALAESILTQKQQDHRDPDENVTLDCGKAVFNAKGGIDFMLDVGKQNADSGHADKAKYEKTAEELNKAKARISETECVAATGAVKGFYECVMDEYNEVAMCAEKYQYWDMILLGGS